MLEMVGFKRRKKKPHPGFEDETVFLCPARGTCKRGLL
jgi:hypothetical protein